MKKYLALLLTILLVITMASCSDTNKTDTSTKDTSSSDNSTGDSTETTLPINAPSGAITEMKEYLNNIEYTTYYNIFYNDTGSEYEGKVLTKEGTFTYIYDAFNQVTRYYVWGYADKTKCCDFQWEFVFPEGTQVPSRGSYVTVKGVFTADDNALDGYWLTDATLKVEETYNGPDYDYDTTTMSGTLARVQIVNMQYYPDVFADKTVLVYGRALNTNSIQHPYYDNAWSMDFKVSDDYLPSTGQYMILGGAVVPSGDTCYLNVDYHVNVE